MEIKPVEHDLDLVPKEYRHIVKVLLDWQDSLSDGYGYYCSWVSSEKWQNYYNQDHVLATLTEIAIEILA